MVERWPDIVCLPVADVMHRLLCLKVETKAACQTPADMLSARVILNKRATKNSTGQASIQMEWLIWGLRFYSSMPVCMTSLLFML